MTIPTLSVTGSISVTSDPVHCVVVSALRNGQLVERADCSIHFVNCASVWPTLMLFKECPVPRCSHQEHIAALHLRCIRLPTPTLANLAAGHLVSLNVEASKV